MNSATIGLVLSLTTEFDKNERDSSLELDRLLLLAQDDPPEIVALTQQSVL